MMRSSATIGAKRHAQQPRIPALPIRSSDPVRCAEAIVDRAGRDIALAIPIGVGKPVAARQCALPPGRGRQAPAPAHLHRPHAGAAALPHQPGAALRRAAARPPVRQLSRSRLRHGAARGGLPPNIEVTEFFLQAGAWLSNAHVQRSYTSLNYSQVAKHLERIGTNVFGQLVAPHPQGEPRISLSSNTDITLDMLPYIVRAADGRPAARARRRDQRQPALHAGRGRDGCERDATSCWRRSARTTSCSRRPRSRCRSPTTPWRCTRRPSSRTAARCRSASARSRTRWRTR